MPPFHGQSDAEGGAPAGAGIGRDFSTVRLGDGAAYGQAQTQTLRLSRHKRLKQAARQCLAKADATVADADLDGMLNGAGLGCRN